MGVAIFRYFLSAPNFVCGGRQYGKNDQAFVAYAGEKCQAQRKNYRLFDGGGLYLEVTTTGSKLWRMKFRQDNGKENRLSFGKFPEVTLEQARQKRDEARSLKAAGIDLAQNRKAQKAKKQEQDANTFEKIAREWHANRLETWQPNTARDILHRFEKDIFPEIGALPVSEITHKQLIDALRKIESRGAHEIAKRTKANCVRVFSYAIQHGLTDRNIANDLTDVLKPVRKGHFAAITSDELPAFLKAMNQNDARLYMPKDGVRKCFYLDPETGEYR